MKKFEIKLSQCLNGWYEGTIMLDAESKEEVYEKLAEMDKRDLDEASEWTHGDDYWGDSNTITIEGINEIL